jgi:hypothetical protein
MYVMCWDKAEHMRRDVAAEWAKVCSMKEEDTVMFIYPSKEIAERRRVCLKNRARYRGWQIVTAVLRNRLEIRMLAR